MHEEEVEAVAAERGRRAEHQRNGQLLALLELGGGIVHFPRGPMFQQYGFEVWRAEDVGQVVFAGPLEDVAEPVVGGETGEDFQRLRRAVGWGAGG